MFPPSLQKGKSMKRTMGLFIAAIAIGWQPAYAQPKAPQGAVVVASEPGKAAAVATVEATVTIVAIAPTARLVTLKGPQGRTMDVVCGEEVKNFDQLRVGDDVRVRYVEALSLELKKRKGPADASVAAGTVGAAPGSTPAGATARQITILADVVAVDPKKSIISLKGPGGNIVDLHVQNPDHFKVVKKGDQVEAVYTQALALAVVPAPKNAGGKK